MKTQSRILSPLSLAAIAAMLSAGLLPLTGCNTPGTEPEVPLNTVGGPVANYAPPAPTPIADAGPTATTAQPIPSDGFATTSAGGYFRITQIRSLAVTSNETFVGFAASGSDFLVLESVYITSGTYRRRILSTPLQPGTGVASWTLLCDLLSDGTSLTGFAADSTYFYFVGGISSDPTHDQYLRRFRRSDCVETTPLDSGRDLNPNGYLTFMHTLAAGRLYYGNGATSPIKLQYWDPSTAANGSAALDTSLGGKSLTSLSSISVAGQSAWALNNYYLWKFSVTGTPTAWTELPSYPYDLDLTYAQAVVAIDASTVIVVRAGSTALKRYFLDVSHF